MSDRPDRIDARHADPADEAFLEFMRASERDPDFDVARFLHEHTGDGDLREAIGVLGTLAAVAAPDEGPPPDPRLQEPLDGRYRIERFLAAGGMGDVYLAKDLRTDASVVVKVLTRTDVEMRHRFRREVQLTATLSHRSRNVVRVSDIAELSDGTPYLVMEYLEGRSLERRLSGGPLPVAVACRIARELAVTLDIVHALGVAHGDIKPGNVILLRRGGGEDDESLFPVLIDFGIARVRGPLLIGPETQEGIYRGTLRYAAPESLDGKIDALTDQLALGVMAWEMMAGKHPFQTIHFTELMDLVRTHVPPPLDTVNPEVPPEIARAVARTMEKRREDRFPNLREFAAALEMSPSKPAISISTSRRAPVTAPPGPGSGARAAIFGVGLVAALGIGVAVERWRTAGGAPAAQPPTAAVIETATSPSTPATAPAALPTAAAAPPSAPAVTPPAATPPVNIAPDIAPPEIAPASKPALALESKSTEKVETPKRVRTAQTAKRKTSPAAAAPAAPAAAAPRLAAPAPPAPPASGDKPAPPPAADSPAPAQAAPAAPETTPPKKTPKTRRPGWDRL